MKKQFFILITSMLIFQSAFFAAEKPKIHQSGGRLIMSTWSWANAAWIADDNPYIGIKNRIINEQKSGKSYTDLMREYQEKALANPNDSKAQFAWGIVVTVLPEAGQAIDKDIAHQVSVALANAMKKQSYEYAHLQFLVTMSWGTFVQLKDLGRKLVKRDPDDYKVKYYLTRILSVGTKEDKQQAIADALSLTQSQPQRASGYGVLGDAYRSVFFAEHNSDIGNKAISAYQKYISLLHDNSSEVSTTEYLIGIIRKWQDKWKR